MVYINGLLKWFAIIPVVQKFTLIYRLTWKDMSDDFWKHFKWNFLLKSYQVIKAMIAVQWWKSIQNSTEASPGTFHSIQYDANSTGPSPKNAGW